MTAKRLDALLVLPPMYQTGRTPDYNPKEPMGLMYLAAELRRRGMRVEILDADLRALTIEETVGEIVAKPAAVIGFSVLQRALPSLKLVVEGVRERGVQSHICCGGVGATLSAPRLLQKLPGVDSVVMGDGELTFADLVERILAGRGWRQAPGLCHQDFWGLNYTSRSTKPDLDILAPPVRDFLPEVMELTNYTTILGSRGCYASCTFCSNSGFEGASCGPKWRGRNPLLIADEIEELRRVHDVRVIKFNDPNLFGPGRRGRAHVELLCRELIRRGLDDLHLMAFTRASDFDLDICRLMKQAGFERVLIGIESADPNALKQFRKGETVQRIERSIRVIREAGLDVIPGFIIFHPYATPDTLLVDLDFLEKHQMTSILAKAMRAFDGTVLQRVMHEDGRLIPCCPFEGYHEYTVDPDMAAIYMGLKTFAVEWFDRLKSVHQHSFLSIKKGPSFNGRVDFYALQGVVYQMEAMLLRALVSWVRDGFTRGDIQRQAEVARRQLLDVEAALLAQSGSATQAALVPEFSSSDIADRVYSILHDKPYTTFPEKYRWAND